MEVIQKYIVEVASPVESYVVSFERNSCFFPDIFCKFLMDSILLVISKMMDYIMGTKMHMNMGLKCGANP